MPPPRIAAAVIWDQTMRLLDPQYRAAFKHVRKDWPDISPVLVSNTIHGSRTLLRHHVRVQRQLVAAFRRMRGPRLVNTPGNVQFGDFAEMAESALIRLADRYDPSRSGFPNYARHRLNGIIKDWRNSWVPTQPFDAAKDDPLWHLYSNDEHPTVLCERIANVVGSYYPGGQKSVRPVRSDDWLAEGLVDLDGERGRLDVIAAAANLTERQKIILAHLRRREDGYTYLASKLGISYDHLKVEISRLKKKLRAVVTK